MSSNQAAPVPVIVCGRRATEHAAGAPTITIDFAGIEDAADLFARIASALSLPDYFGHNWDALDECLRDLSGQHEAGLRVVALSAGGAWRDQHELLGLLTSLFIDVAAEWASEGKSLSLIFDLD